MIRCGTAEARGSLLGSIQTVKHSNNVLVARGSRVTLGCIDHSKRDESSLRVIGSSAYRTIANIRIIVLRVKIPLLKGFFSTCWGFLRDGSVCGTHLVREQTRIYPTRTNILHKVNNVNRQTTVIVIRLKGKLSHETNLSLSLGGERGISTRKIVM